MTATVTDFTSEVFAFIEVTYGKKVIKKVKHKDNIEIIKNITDDSESKEYTVDKTAHKIMAMLRIIPS